MPINYDKTTSMLIGTRQKIRNIDKLNIHIDDNNIKAVSSQKLLGIIIDENLLGIHTLIILAPRYQLGFPSWDSCHIMYQKLYKNILSGLHSAVNRLWMKYVGSNK